MNCAKVFLYKKLYILIENKNNKLYMIALGCMPEKRVTEQPNIFF